ncbi:hypothetical protein [Falsiroseomonas sp. CW058]|uniref:hypothetical protein n=1 Tax=Falsiroseomonas sp. CW058 TaxID=3388664 RepID=UPI003D31C90E
MRPSRCLAALLLATMLPAPAPAQPAPGAFVEIVPTEGRAAVHVATAQVVRIGRAEGATVIDTTSFVQQRSAEALETVARRMAAAGLRLLPLTDPSGGRVYLVPDRIVLVRDSGERHAAGARAAIVMVGLRYGFDVAVRETVEQVMAALRRGDAPPEAPAAAAPR